MEMAPEEAALTVVGAYLNPALLEALPVRIRLALISPRTGPIGAAQTLFVGVNVLQLSDVCWFHTRNTPYTQLSAVEPHHIRPADRPTAMHGLAQSPDRTEHRKPTDSLVRHLGGTSHR